MSRRKLSGTEIERQRAVTRLLKRYRTLVDTAKIPSDLGAAEEAMEKAQAIISYTTTKRMGDSK